MCRRAYEQLLPYFEDMLESQGWLDTLEKSDKILEYIDTSTDTVEAASAWKDAAEQHSSDRESGAHALLLVVAVFLCPF